MALRSLRLGGQQTWFAQTGSAVRASLRGPRSMWFRGKGPDTGRPGSPSETLALFDVQGDLAAWCIDHTACSNCSYLSSEARQRGWPRFVSLYSFILISTPPLLCVLSKWISLPLQVLRWMHQTKSGRTASGRTGGLSEVLTLCVELP